MIQPGDRDPDSPEKSLTPGERLFYALGQLYRLWRQGALDVAPIDFDIRDLARIIGVAGDIEFISDGPLGRTRCWSPTNALFPGACSTSTNGRC